MEKSRLQSSYSRRNKENGTKSRSIEYSKSRSLDTVKAKSVKKTMNEPAEKKMQNHENEGDQESKAHSFEQTADMSLKLQNCTEKDVQTFHVTLTYKPRI